MRVSLSLLIITAWVVAPVARAQTPPATTHPPATHSAEARSDGTAIRRAGSARPSPVPSTRHSPRRRASAGKTGGVLALGATDITGNKELPKVMVIVPWKDSLGAGGVVKPTDSLLNEALEPVDRSVFQRQIHYYGQLKAGEEQSGAGKVAPVGDKR
jgi:hypothetical protein